MTHRAPSVGGGDGAEYIDVTKVDWPRSVALVAFGHKTSPWARDLFTRENYVANDEMIFDLRKLMEDPLNSLRVSQGVGAESERTQLAVHRPQFNANNVINHHQLLRAIMLK
jgi:hypothetical protein